MSVKNSFSSFASDWYKKNRSLVLRQTPVWAQSLSLIVISLGAIAVTGAYFFKIDEVVSVSGRLQSKLGSRPVQSPVGGKVFELKVSEGQQVKKDQILLVFDTREALNKQQLLEKTLDIELNELESKTNILNGRQKVIKKKILTQQKLLAESEELLKLGAYQRIRYLEQEDRLFQLENDLSEVKLELERNILSSGKSINQIKSELLSTNLQLQYQTIKAPVDGIVFQVNALKDGVIRASDTILTLIPQKGLNAKVFVANKDIGFVERGQNVKIRVDAFPYTTYGELEGKITNVGADVLPPDNKESFYRFPVTITLSKQTLSRNDNLIPLQAGMSVTGNIKLREKRVISLISDLLVNQADSVRTIRQ